MSEKKNAIVDQVNSGFEDSFVPIAASRRLPAEKVNDEDVFIFSIRTESIPSCHTTEQHSLSSLVFQSIFPVSSQK